MSKRCELDQRDAELFAEHLIEMLPGNELQVEEYFAQVPRVSALKLQRAVQLVLADEPKLEQTRAELERRDGALAPQAHGAIDRGSAPVRPCRGLPHRWGRK